MTRKEILDQIESTGVSSLVTYEKLPNGGFGERVASERPIGLAFKAAAQGQR